MARTYLLRLSIVFLLFGGVGCEFLGIEDVFEDEKEIEGVVEAVGEDFVTVDGVRYTVTNETDFEEGYTSLSDVAIDDQVEVEYEEHNGERVALGVEPGSS